MTMLVVTTQDYENAAAAPDFTGEYAWKAKGGSEYKITKLPSNVNLEEIVSMVRSTIEQNNEYFRTIILGYETQPDDYLSWFEESQLEFDGKITWEEPIIEYSELNGSFA